jgi:putative ABC transport system permease protein
MKALSKKLWRDLWHLRGQIIATALVVACGVASFVSMRSTYDSLLATQQNYYNAYRFADVFAHLNRTNPSNGPQKQTRNLSVALYESFKHLLLLDLGLRFTPP